MSDEALHKPKNQEQDRLYNQEPGIAIIPNTPYAREMERYEQFPSRFGQTPGNPYKYRPFPKMLYKADHYMGAVKCMAAPPDAAEYMNPKEYEMHMESARRFTENCQRIVNSEAEMQKALEGGWRESPTEAIEHVLRVDRVISTGAAERNYEDRGMSEKAKREAAQIAAEAGEHLAEIPEQPRVKRKYTRRKKAE